MSYRRLAGICLLWAIAPLPFLYIVLPPFWLTAAAAGCLLVVLPGRAFRIPTWGLNLLGVGILAAVVAASGVRVGPLRPLGHLLVLLTSVRALQVVDRRSFTRFAAPVFLVWLVSLTSSTHVAVLLYFTLSVAWWWWLGMQYQLLGAVRPSASSSWPKVAPAHAAVAAVLALLLAVPVFLVMPRLRTPWIAGRSGMQSVTGFSDRVELSGVGTIRQSQEEAVVVRAVRGGPIRPEWMRLRATAYERVTIDSWAPRRAEEIVGSDDGVVYPHGPGWDLDGAAELEIVVRRPDRYLFVPTGTVAVSTDHPVRLDPAGGIVLADRVAEPVRLTAWVWPGEAPRFIDPPRVEGPRFEPPAEVAALARRIVGRRSGAAERAAAIEAHLRDNFSYSLSGMARIGPDPMSWFLLSSRRGHCEYFAGGMVVLLEALEVEARMVGGYSGGSVSADGREVVVREANAHTWVEVWLGPARGWQAYDPTPSVGVPGLDRGRRGFELRAAWEWVQASWDRYVLTYGLGEQLQLLGALGEAAIGTLRRLGSRGLAVVIVAVALSWLLGWLLRRLWRSRPTGRRLRRPPAARAIERLRRRVVRAGVELSPAATVRMIGRSVGERWPDAAAAVADLVWRAERELYSGRVADRRSEVQLLWRRVQRATRGGGRSGPR